MTTSRVPKALRVVLAATAGAALAACAVGPDYVRPKAETPAAFKEADDAGQWKTAAPADAQGRGTWWKAFGDPKLDALLEQVNVSNQNVAAFEARFRQARALVEAARAAYFPTLSAGASYNRFQQSQTVGNAKFAPRGTFTDYSAPLQASWEVDVWGKLRRALEAQQASAQASAADLESTRLSAQAELAADYFQLRGIDAQRALLDSTIAAYQKSLQLTVNRYNSGVAARADIEQADTQLKTTQAQAIDLGVQRAQLEHAIAILIGKAPAEFSLLPLPLDAQPPPIPAGLPSELLERRPDIASAERQVAAANAQIGVAKAAYFPTLTLGASAGFESAPAAQWLTWPSRFWSVGPALAETIFDAGLRKAQTEQAIAAYDATVATYRQTVLAAFQDVEDNLAALRVLAEEAKAQDAAVQAAARSVVYTTNQYKAGVVSYLNVVTAQATELSNRLTAAGIAQRRMTAAVNLIRALGGGWSAGELPGADALLTGSR
ncbi:MAG TPA: efflux transporter outer membrane subunit [Burkholderiales bacterium]|nr:efflux transporter outer membrane subunit [Burkholderiales bacterium]